MSLSIKEKVGIRQVRKGWFYAIDANCVIRVYKSEEEYDGEKYRILGAHCYTKAQDGKWKCIDRLGEEYGIDLTKHVIRTWFFQDDSWDVSVDFFDTYVKLVKEN